MPGVKCREFESALIEGARVTAHLEVCEDCRMAFERQIRLRAAARVLAAEAARFSTPAKVEQALLREMANVHVLRRRRIVYSIAGGAIAAALALTVWMMHQSEPRRPVIRIASRVPQAAAPVLVVVEQPVAQHFNKRRSRAAKSAHAPQQPFIAIPYTSPLEPYERADVMRMDLPVSALIAAGLPMSMADPAALARADVLVGQDGRARAIRLVSVSASSTSSN